MKSLQVTEPNDSTKLFEENLLPVFDVLAASQEHVMDKLTASLRKALLMMAIERYGYDSRRICRGLGISRAKLDSELRRLGLACG